MSIHKIIDGDIFRKSTDSRIRRCVGVSIKKDNIRITNMSNKQAILNFTHGEWRDFIKGVKSGEFNII